MDRINDYMQLIYISAQPASQYYAWQAEVYIHQFQRLGIAMTDIHVIAGHSNSQPIDESWIKLMCRFPDAVIEFYRYDDCEYAPAMQPQVLSKHWQKYPHLESYACFYHDADFIFTKPFDFTRYLSDDTWYFSDTISYIGADYIKSKSSSILDIMCHTVGIDRSIVEANQQNSGGAQKLMKNVTSRYWDEVYIHSVNLYDVLKKVKHIKKPDDQYGIQIWTASMWAELWTAWKTGIKVEVPKEFDFCWATCHVSKWNDLSFFHNAGVPSSGRGMFFKADYIDRLPYGHEVLVDDNHCSRKYYDIVQSIDSCLK
jgi:hypothetical protein